MKHAYAVSILCGRYDCTGIIKQLLDRGHVVKAWPLDKEIASHLKNSFDESLGKKCTISGDLFTVLKDAEVIIINLPYSNTLAFLEEIVRSLRNHQTIIVYPGFTWSAVIFYQFAREKRPELELNVGEIASTCGWCEIVKVSTDLERAMENEGEFCFFPEIKNKYVDYIMDSLFPGFRSVNDIRSTSMCNFSGILEPAVLVFSLANLESAKFAFVPEMARLAERLDAERCALMKKLNLNPITIPRWVKNVRNGHYYDYFTIFNEISAFQELPLAHIRKEFADSIRGGLEQFCGAARKLGMDTPSMDALIHLSKIVLDQDDLNVNEKRQEVNYLEAIQLEPQETTEREQSFPIESVLNELCDQIARDLQEGMLYIQAPLNVMLSFKELVHEISGEGLHRGNWKQYYASREKDITIAVTTKSNALKNLLEAGDDFNNCYGFILFLERGVLKIKTLLFLTEGEFKDFVEGLKNDLKNHLKSIFPSNNDTSGKKITSKDFSMPDNEN